MTSEIKKLILSRSDEIHSEAVRIRRHLHKHPELSYEEKNTSAFISRWLASNNIPYKDNIAGTGVIAEIKGTGSGDRTVAVRAEMDALPVFEKNETDYASINPGIMHACGHDAHMAIVMGTAMVIKSLSSHFGGTLLLVFQPGEEKSPGGAKLMIEDGAFNEKKPDAILATHNLPELTAGEIGYKAGRYMASCDEIYITVRGRGGHAALPGLTTDQILIASKLVVRLKEQIPHAAEERKIPTVLGIGKISGEGATNVIPEKVEISGTFRTFDEKWRSEGISMVRKITEETADEYGVTAEVRIEEGYPVLINDESLTLKAASLSEDLLGKDKIKYLETRLTSDDFSFYAAVAPTLYYRTGMGSVTSEGEIRKLHTSVFDIDEEGLRTGIANMSWIVYNFLRE